MNNYYILYDKIKRENQNTFVCFEIIEDGIEYIYVIKDDAFLCVKHLDFSFIDNEGKNEICFLKVNIHFMVKIIKLLIKLDFKICYVSELLSTDSTQLKLF